MRKFAEINLFPILWLVLFATACDDGPNNNGDGGSDTDSDADYEWCDETTSLCWQIDVEPGNWYEAVDHCDNLSLGGHDDWYLPSIDELRSLIRGCSATMTGGECPIVEGSGNDDFNDVCFGCTLLDNTNHPQGCYWDTGMGEECVFPDGVNWSDSEDTEYSPSGRAWLLEYDEANIDSSLKTNIYRARCVRAMD